MILYPTETVYALGVNAFDEQELAKLYELKGRDEGKPVSLLVRSIADIERYAELSPRGRRVAEAFLPGPMTLVLCAHDEVPRTSVAPDGTHSFRISSDLLAQKLIEEFMDVHDAPLTCTSANVSGLPTLATVVEIEKQFLEFHHTKNLPIDWKVLDDGPRSGVTSTVVRIMQDTITILREGAISEADIRAV